MNKKTRPYRELLLERLANPTIAAHYLDAAMEESQESYLKALRNVAQAKQMSKVAKETGVQRESLYRILSDTGNPTLETLRGIYDSLGLRLATFPKDAEKEEPSRVHEPIFYGWYESSPAVAPGKEYTTSAQHTWFTSGITTNLSDQIGAAYPFRFSNEFFSTPANAIARESIQSPPSGPQYWIKIEQGRVAA